MGIVLNTNVVNKGEPFYNSLEKVWNNHDRLFINRNDQYAGAHCDGRKVIRQKTGKIADVILSPHYHHVEFGLHHFFF